MTEPRTRKFHAIVLGSRRWREKDRIVYFLCEGYGRLDAAVFGARKVSGRWTGKFEPFNVVDILVTCKKPGMPWSVREVEPVCFREHGASAREVLVVQAAAEFLVHVSPGEEIGQEAFESIAAFPVALAGAAHPLTILLAFVFHWFARSGFGLPVEGSEASRKFVARSAVDPPSLWRRYRLKPEQSSQLVALAKRHVEICTDRRWRGIEIL